MKKTIIILIVLVIIALVVYFLAANTEDQDGTDLPVDTKTETDVPSEISDSEDVDAVNEPYEVIGVSIEGRELKAYRFGDGENTLGNRLLTFVPPQTLGAGSSQGSQRPELHRDTRRHLVAKDHFLVSKRIQGSPAGQLPLSRPRD